MIARERVVVNYVARSPGPSVRRIRVERDPAGTSREDVAIRDDAHVPDLSGVIVHGVDSRIRSAVRWQIFPPTPRSTSGG